MSTALLHITVATHNFTVTRMTARTREVLSGFIKGNVQMGLVRQPGGRFVTAGLKVFGAATASREEFRFHINQYKEFLEFLARNYITDTLYTIEHKPVPVAETFSIELKDKREPKPEQVPVIEYLDAVVPYRSKFVDLQTGGGKTFISLKSIHKNAKRTVAIVKPMYIEKWTKDFFDAYELTLDDIMVVRGSEHLQALLVLAEAGMLTSKFIIISNKTIQNWIKLYEIHERGTLDLGYACLPGDLFQCLSAGMRLIDEVHQDFHLNFKIDLYTNIEKSISLSATLLNNDAFMERMYKLAYPLNQRYAGTPLKKYVVAKAVMYSLKAQTHVRTTEFGSTTYSHVAFEKSILKNGIVRESYFRLILNTIGIGFMRDYKPGEKCAIFCASIDMCTELVKFLKRMYPQLDIRRYVAEDPQTNLHEPDIRVTTILSGGTAHDIAMLKTVILTIAVDSIQANIQTLGRLRLLKDMTMQFLYLVCNDIPKHVEYHQRKERMLLERAASYQVINAPDLV